MAIAEEECGHTVGQVVRVDVALHGDHQVAINLVRHLGGTIRGNISTARVSDKRFHTQRHHAALNTVRYIPHHFVVQVRNILRQQLPILASAVIHMRVQDNAFAGQTRTGRANNLLFHNVGGGTAGNAPTQPAKRLEGGGAADTVSREAKLPLVVQQGNVSVGAKNAVDPAGVETQLLEGVLEGSNVVTENKVGGHEIEDATAQFVASFGEGAAGHGAHVAVDNEPPLLLKGADGSGEVVLGIHNKTQLNELLTHVSGGGGVRAGFCHDESPSAPDTRMA